LATRRGVPWWVPLLSGGLWLVFAFVVLSFSFTTVLAIAVFAGVSSLLAGANELAIASALPNWQLGHLLLGVLSTAAGVVALVWPGITFVVLAALVAWLLLFKGASDFVGALVYRHELWWLQLITGVIEVAVAFWAIGYPARSFVLLAVWVATTALLRGISHIVLALAVSDALGLRSGDGTLPTGDRRSAFERRMGCAPDGHLGRLLVTK
jgi:uncharacterized membrane protein HdeD (DUF308 family)